MIQNIDIFNMDVELYEAVSPIVDPGGVVGHFIFILTHKQP